VEGEAIELRYCSGHVMDSTYQRTNNWGLARPSKNLSVAGQTDSPYEEAHRPMCLSILSCAKLVVDEGRDGLLQLSHHFQQATAASHIKSFVNSRGSKFL
jgi:hypothetical protein